MCSNYGATEVKSLTIYMCGPMYTRHHEQSLTFARRTVQQVRARLYAAKVACFSA